MKNVRHAARTVAITRSALALTLALSVLAFGCSSSGDDDDTSGSGGAGAGSGGTTGSGGTSNAGSGGASVGSGGKGGSGGITGSGGKGGSGGITGSGGSGGSGGASGSGGADADSGMPDGGGMMDNGNDLTGMLGSLGAVKPVLNGWAISTGVETIIYLSSSPLTCAQMMTMGVKWLSTLPAGTQVIEIVMRGTAMVQMYNVGFLQGEVNYAEGSKSSSSETVGDGGSFTITKAEPMGVIEGTVDAMFPMGSVMGSFHAEWCEGGTEY